MWRGNDQMPHTLPVAHQLPLRVSAPCGLMLVSLKAWEQAHPTLWGFTSSSAVNPSSHPFPSTRTLLSSVSLVGARSHTPSLRAPLPWKQELE